MREIDYAKIAEAGRLAEDMSKASGRKEAAQVALKAAEAEFAAALYELRSIERKLRDMLADAGLPLYAPHKPAGGRPGKMPKGIVTKNAYARRMGLSEGKYVTRKLRAAGIPEVGIVDEYNGIVVEKADSAVIAAAAEGRIDRKYADAIRRAQAEEAAASPEPEPTPEPEKPRSEIERAIETLAARGITVERQRAGLYVVKEPGKPQLWLKESNVIEKAEALDMPAEAA